MSRVRRPTGEDSAQGLAFAPRRSEFILRTLFNHREAIGEIAELLSQGLLTGLSCLTVGLGAKLRISRGLGEASLVQGLLVGERRLCLLDHSGLDGLSDVMMGLPLPVKLAPKSCDLRLCVAALFRR